MSGSTKTPAEGLAHSGLSDAERRGPATDDPKTSQLKRLEALVDRRTAEVVLRYIGGRRVLDVGRGAPALDSLVEARALEFVTHPIELDTPAVGALPFDDESFDVVFCVRTLAHVGVDEASSIAGARQLLAEISRVLVPGGHALVQIDNPKSLRGALYGIRHPITVVASGPLVVEADHGVTRFDTLGRFLGLLPDTLGMIDVHGIQVAVPSANVLGMPVLGRLLSRIEWYARDIGPLRTFGAHLLVVVRKLCRSGDAE